MTKAEYERLAVIFQEAAAAACPAYQTFSYNLPDNYTSRSFGEAEAITGKVLHEIANGFRRAAAEWSPK